MPPLSRLMLSVVVFAATGCAAGPLPVLQPDSEWVSWETVTPPMCGKCNSTKLTVAYDGRVWIEQGHWAGRYRNWRAARRLVQVSPEALVRFREHLETLRPIGDLTLDGPPLCESYEADDGGITVVWHDRQGQSRLTYDYGCDTDTRGAMREALEAAPSQLQISELHIRE